MKNGWKRTQIQPNKSNDYNQYAYRHEERNIEFTCEKHIRPYLKKPWFDFKYENFDFKLDTQDIQRSISVNPRDILNFDLERANIYKENQEIQVILERPHDTDGQKDYERKRDDITDFVENNWILTYDYHENDKKRLKHR